MRPLFPPLEAIERSIFRPSDALLARLASGDRAVALHLRAAVEADAESVQVLAELRASTSSPTSEGTVVTPVQEAIPMDIADLIRRRVASAARTYGAGPSAGQILAVDSVVGPNGDLGWDLPRPLAVLIETPSVKADGSENQSVWYGWMLAAETDYAGYWDFVLSIDDEPFDPIAGMVQVWNPVYVYLKSTTRVLGELSPTRLQAVRALAEEYLTASEPDPVDARPGLVALRATLGGLQVLTGTPLGGEEDPRWRFQEIYHDVAEAVRLPAKLAWAEAMSTNWLARLMGAGRALGAGPAGLALMSRPIIPVVAPQALSDGTIGESDAFQIEGLVEARRQINGDHIAVSIHSLTSEPIRILVIEGENETARYLLTPARPDRTLRFDRDRDYLLVLTDLEERFRYGIE